MLIAYYRLYGEVVNMYESVLTKQFYHGRTEAMRGTTAAAEKLMKCWTSRSSSTEEKMIALREATKTHSKLVRQAAEGNGVDRHLYALKCIAEKNGIASDLFSSEAYKALNHTVLSTSNCGNPSLRLFGFGPVVPDGYGVGYIIKDHGLQYSISSKHRQTKRYALSLKETLLEMEDLLEPLNKPDQGIRTAFEKMSMYRFRPTRK
jgi:carnitine O-acetyltransferase